VAVAVTPPDAQAGADLAPHSRHPAGVNRGLPPRRGLGADGTVVDWNRVAKEGRAGSRENQACGIARHRFGRGRDLSSSRSTMRWSNQAFYRVGTAVDSDGKPVGVG